MIKAHPIHRLSVIEALEKKHKPIHLAKIEARTDTARWRILVVMKDGNIRDITMDFARATGMRYDHLRKAIKSTPFVFNGTDVAAKMEEVFNYKPEVRLI